MIGDETIILDMRRGRYSLLDRIASLMWQALLCGDAEELSLRLGDIHGLPTSRISEDISRFADRCLETGWLAPAADVVPVMGKTPTAALRKPWSARGLTVKALLSMMAATARLREGLVSAIETSQRLAVSVALIPPSRDTAALLKRALRAFLLAENVWSFKAAPDDCLPRSLALHAYLRQLGLPVEHRIGVRAPPIEMHAWVEFEGRALFDDQTSGYTLMARTP